MRSPDQRKSNRPERAAGWLAVFCLAMIALMSAEPFFTNASRPQNGISDPVLALQMARNVRDVDAVLSDAPSPDREVMRFKQYEDFAFIAGYAALYLSLAALLSRRAKRLALAAAVLGLAAAVLDISENVAILRVIDTPLNQTTQALIDAIRDRSLAKWACAFLSIGALSVYFLRDRQRTARLTGAVYLLACAAGLFGLFHNSVLIAGPLLIAIGLCGTAGVFLLLRRTQA